MTLNEYYEIILEKYKSGDYKIKGSKKLEPKPEINEKEFPLYALNYMIYEYLKDNKDNRWKLLLDFILIPRGVNKGKFDIDFKNLDFEEFFYFMVSVKN
jgi:hypothetical protein